MEVLLTVPSSSRSKCRGRQVLYKLLSHRSNGGLNHDIKIGNKFFESVAKLKYFGTTLKPIMKKLHAVELGECLLQFGPESCVFSTAYQKYEE